MPGIYSVFIINKSGGLIFNKVCAGRQLHVNMMLRHAALVLAKHGEESFQSSSFAGVPVDKWLEPQRHAPLGQHLVRHGPTSSAACRSIVCCCGHLCCYILLASSQRRPSAKQHPCHKTMSNTVSISQALAARDRGAACTVTGLQWHRRPVRRHLHAALLSGQLQRTRALHASKTDKSAPHLLQEQAQQAHMLALWGT